MTWTSRDFLFSCLFLFCFLAACGEEGMLEVEDDDTHGHDHMEEVDEGLVVAPLSKRRVNCNVQRRNDAYSRGNRRDISVLTIDSKMVEVQTAHGFWRMAAAAEREGVNLTIISGFRTMASQQYLYNCYRTKRCNGGNKAARPGYSNHQSGLALDIYRGRGVVSWLRRNGRRFGFLETVSGEPWHWEYRSNYDQTKASPSGLCGGSAGGGKAYDVDLKVRWTGAPNPLTQGHSAVIADAVEGDSFNAVVTIKNQGTASWKNVVLGYWVEAPYIGAGGYHIDTDWPKYDQQSWRRSNADTHPQNAARLGQSGLVHMKDFAAGESKQVVIEMSALRSSLGRVDHPDVRFWVRHIDNVYGEQVGWSAPPTNGNAFGRQVQAFAQVDVLGQDEWSFRGPGAGELDGWHGPSGSVGTMRIDTAQRVLAIDVTGNDPYIHAPAWTSIDANRYDQMVLVTRSSGGPHTKSVYFAHKGESFSESRVVSFGGAGGGGWETTVVPMGSHAQWRGEISGLRLDPTSGSQRGRVEVRALYFQDSRTKQTSSPHFPYQGR